MGVSSGFEEPLYEVDRHLFFNDDMQWGLAFTPIAVVDVGAPHQQLLAAHGVLPHEVEGEDVEAGKTVLLVIVFAPQTQVHADVVKTVNGSIDQWTLPRSGGGVDVGSMVTEHLDRPNTRERYCLEKRRVVSVLLLLVEDFGSVFEQ